MTLDYALDCYRSNPTPETALAFAKEISQYHGDGMIADSTAARYAAELEAAGFKTAMLHIMGDR